MLGWGKVLLNGIGTQANSAAAYLNPTTNVYSTAALAAALGSVTTIYSSNIKDYANYGLEVAKAYCLVPAAEFVADHPGITSGITAATTAVALDYFVVKPHGFSKTVSALINIGSAAAVGVATYFGAEMFAEDNSVPVYVSGADGIEAQ